MDDALRTKLTSLAAAQAGAFRWGQALALGVPIGAAETAVRRGHWVRLRHGVYATREEVERRAGNAAATHALRCAAELLAIGGERAISHRWAAAVQDMPFLGALTDRPQLTRVRSRAEESSERRELHLAQLPSGHLTTAYDVPVTGPARLACDLAREDGLRAGVVAMDAALQAGATLDELDEMANYCWHWPGGAFAQDALGLARPGSESALESIGRLAFVDGGVPEPELQIEVYRWNTLIGRVDQLWERELIAGEADGAVKYDGINPVTGKPTLHTLYDEKRRQEGIESCGLAIVRYDWDDAWQRPGPLCARWRDKEGTAGQRQLAPGVTLRRTVRRAA